MDSSAVNIWSETIYEIWINHLGPMKTVLKVCYTDVRRIGYQLVGELMDYISDSKDL